MPAAGTPSPADVAVKKKGLHIAPETRSAAMKALNNMKKRDPGFEISEDALKTYVVLKALLPCDKSTITKGMLESAKVDVGRSTTLGSKYYVQWRTALPAAPAECQRYLRGARAIADFPAGISPGDVWIFAKGVNTDLIGDDYRYIKSEGTISRTVAIDGGGLPALADGGESQEAAPAAAGGPQEAAPAAAGAAPAEGAAPAPDLPPQEPGAAAEEADVFRTIAVARKGFAEKKQRVPPEGQVHPRTVLFWANRFATYLSEQDAGVAPARYDQKLLDFLMTTLLGMEDFGAFLEFRPFLEALDALPGDAFPSIGKAILHLAQADASSWAPVDPPLDVKDQPLFFFSTLYTAFESARFEARLLSAKGDAVGEHADRLDVAKRLKAEAAS
ncbi:unnamed protein product [Prorocentrum cordatum]|uniref:Defective in cullin neddylation protein n=1 Tax=Prorocentrum cordatum TaxID=2364126 RepID=A0ABN9VMC1_9DINO|nr:unnamed protein product [Polarella glacialis]